MHWNFEVVKKKWCICMLMPILGVVNCCVDFVYKVVEAVSCLFVHIVHHQKLSTWIYLHFDPHIPHQRHLNLSYLLQGSQIEYFNISLLRQNSKK